MERFIRATRCLLLHSTSQIFSSNPSRSLLPLINSSFTHSQKKSFSATQDTNSEGSVLRDYLIGSLKFSNDRALAISRKFPSVKSQEKPEKVVLFFKALGFSDAHIQAIARGRSSILFFDVEKTLKPKIMFFEEHGLSGPRLGAFLSKSPGLLHYNVDRNLKPCCHLIKKVLAESGRNASNAKVNDDVFQILARCNSLVLYRYILEPNIYYLEGCGIRGSQLSSLLLRQTRIFALSVDKIVGLTRKANHMGVPEGSRMLARTIHAIHSTGVKTLNGRFKMLRMLGFSKDELFSMFRKSPSVFALSDTKLRWKMEFFLNDLKISKSVLVQNPVLLSYSIEERVIPRYKVLEMLESRGLLTKESSFASAIIMSNDQFLKKYIFKFKNGASEVLSAYNGQLTDSSKK